MPEVALLGSKFDMKIAEDSNPSRDIWTRTNLHLAGSTRVRLWMEPLRRPATLLLILGGTLPAPIDSQGFLQAAQGQMSLIESIGNIEPGTYNFELYSNDVQLVKSYVNHGNARSFVDLRYVHFINPIYPGQNLAVQ